MEQREGQKAEKYARLIAVANRQASEGKRVSKPVFSPFALSSTGDLGVGADALKEWIITQFQVKCKKAAARADGLTPKELICDFRHRIKIALQFSVAVGMGNLICAAGLPTGVR